MFQRHTELKWALTNMRLAGISVDISSDFAAVAAPLLLLLRSLLLLMRLLLLLPWAALLGLRVWPGPAGLTRPCLPRDASL